ncbi:1-phosphatidylinositol 4,5-bisphosphate phosphodiesterase zeta-1 [Sorex fumeus]|uniref:1-phosphatidylinositol 4,5-bisphosphate phosphodiesterase zeta-1 n=1 Tax=Sorex fumeus TaxID=62283 RepID=UPI0024AD79F9|nr:1-phosphatidylinositol 4,5-bisphosphate phosphodiesterase zeta-1 [Sorex fumeus]
MTFCEDFLNIFVLNRWFLSMITEEFKGGKITVEAAHKLLEKLHIHCSLSHFKDIFKDNDRLNLGRITIEEFRAIYRTVAHREELLEIFNAYSEDRKFIYKKNMINFLTKEQYILDVNDSVVYDIFEKYEPIEEVKKEKKMSLEGFVRYMASSECLIFNTKCDKVYQDMNHPISDYYISSSHNTYLISDQIIGPSDLWGYVSALVKGCRCLEIDCWDGSQNEPVVYHGYTLTSKILFKTVIQSIQKYAFVSSDYPVVLSLENHCSPRQQEVMARNLLSTFGEALLSDVLEDFPDRLPSPEALKFKILVKNKKVGTLKETHDRKGFDKHGQVQDYEEDDSPDPQTSSSETVNAKKSSDNLRTSSSILSVFKKKREKVSLALSDLVIYTKAEKFRSFQYSRQFQQFNEANSIEETEARKLSKLQAPEFVIHTQKFITRIYPDATRTNSSNFNPQEFWNIGCQMVALNFQTPGTPMDLQTGRFLDNGGAGYVLKPKFLRDEKSNFDPNVPPKDDNPFTVTIRLISGIQLLPNFASSSTANAFVIIEVFGVPNDKMKQQTRVIKKNAFNPKWNETFTFVIAVPELALIRFVAESQNLIVGTEFLGQYTLPVLCMNRGYRRVPLYSKEGSSLDPASLFIYVWYIR